MSINQLLQNLYPHKFTPCKQTQHNHHIFIPFVDKILNQHVYFQQFEMPNEMFTSQAITQLYRKKLGRILARVRIMEVQRLMEKSLYIVQSSANLITLRQFVGIKRDCGELIDTKIIFKMLNFLQDSYPMMSKSSMKLCSFDQMVMNSNQEILLYDPKLYFRSFRDDIRQGKTPEQWISQILQEILDIKNVKDNGLVQEKLEASFGSSLEDFKKLLKDIMQMKIKYSDIPRKMNVFTSNISEEITTVTSSFVSVSQIPDQYSLEERLLHSSSVKNAKKKMTGKTKAVIIFIVLAVLSVGAYFTIKALTKQIICNPGQFLNTSKMCMPCSQGCLECLNGGNSVCMKCEPKKFLAIYEQDQKLGKCVDDCKTGRQIKNNMCIISNQKEETGML